MGGQENEMEIEDSVEFPPKTSMVPKGSTVALAVRHGGFWRKQKRVILTTMRIPYSRVQVGTLISIHVSLRYITLKSRCWGDVSSLRPFITNVGASF